MALVSKILNPNPIYVKNHDHKINNVVTNNVNANRSMIRAHRARLDKQNKKRVNALSYETYSDITPHDQYNVGNIIHDWQYGAKELSQSADNSRNRARTMSIKKRKASANEYNREFTKTVNEPFKFKVGYQNTTKNLDELDKPYLHRNIDKMQGKDMYLVKTQQMLHGDANTYFPGMPETLRSNSLHRGTTQRELERSKNRACHGTVKDYYIVELEKDNNLYDQKNNQLKRRQYANVNHPKSLLKQIKTYENTTLMKANEKADPFEEFERTHGDFYDPVHEEVKFNNFCTTNDSFHKSKDGFFPQLNEPESTKYGSFYASRTSCNTPDGNWVPNMDNKMPGMYKTTRVDDFYNNSHNSNRLHGLENLDKIKKNNNFNTKGAFANQNVSQSRWNVENKHIAKGPNFKRFVSNGDFSKSKSPFGETSTQFMHGIPKKNAMGDTGMSIGRVPFQIQRSFKRN